MKANSSHAIFVRRLPIYAALLEMPPRNHWPHRPEPFEWGRSEVIHFITAHGVDIDEARRIFYAANQQRLIRFDRATKLWSGRQMATQTQEDKTNDAPAATPPKPVVNSPILQWLDDNEDAIRAEIECGFTVLNFKSDAPVRLRWLTQAHAAS